MANAIKPKRSYTSAMVPTTADLETNELAINWADGIAYTKDASGNIVTVVLGGGGGGSFSWSAVPASPDETAAAGSLAYDDDYLYVATAANTWKRAALSTWTDGPVDDYFSSVALLLHMDGEGGTFTDSSATPKTITAVGGATQSTAESKWGGKSLALNGSSDNLSLSSSGFTLSGDFVIECWVFLESVSAYAAILESRTSPSYANFICGIYSVGGVLRPDFVTAGGGGARLTGSSTSIQLNQWNHVAFVRSSGVMAVYVNGTRDNATILYPDTMSPASATMLIGRNVDGNFVDGYFDDLRVTIGTDRGYTGATITVPTEAFPDQGVGGGGGSVTSYTVSNAGSSDVNGTYTQSGTNEGRPVYAQDGGVYSIRFVTTPEAMWVIDEGDGYQPVYDNLDTANTVPLSGWGVAYGSGSAPEPTITAN